MAGTWITDIQLDNFLALILKPVGMIQHGTANFVADTAKFVGL